jgi:hypothetical protein
MVNGWNSSKSWCPSSQLQNMNVRLQAQFVGQQVVQHSLALPGLSAFQSSKRCEGFVRHRF